MRGVLKSVVIAFTHLAKDVDFLRQGLLLTGAFFEKLGSNCVHIVLKCIRKLFGIVLLDSDLIKSK